MRQKLSKYLFLLCCSIWLIPATGTSQCQDWRITANVITASTCAANGSFEVMISGRDAPNLTNIQFGVPASGNYSVPLNNNSVFTSVPQGIREVSAVALCGGNFVGKNTTVTMPGDYALPVLYELTTSRNSLNCHNTGILAVNIKDGRAPYTISMTNAPTAYTGPRTFTMPSNLFNIPDLAAGSYTIQAIDACNNGTLLRTAYVGSLNPGGLPLTQPSVNASGCNALIIPKPGVNTFNNDWPGYPDQLFTVAAVIANGISSQTGFEPFGGSFTVPLAGGRTIKDCYGATIRYTIRPVCGADFYMSYSIPYPLVNHSINQNCNTDFKANITLVGLVCLPITYTITETGSGISHGTYTTNSASFSTPSLPLGSYTAQYTTADGYTFNSTFSTSPVTGVPYSVTVINGSNGLHNYINGFRFSSRLPSSARKTIELFNGPATYTHLNYWFDTNDDYIIGENQTPAAGKYKFIPGNYVWKITDDCGTYLLPVTVGAPDLFQFSAWTDSIRQTCKGLLVWPGGSAANNGQSVPVQFRILKDGSPFPAGGNSWTTYVPGQSLLLSTPATYTIIPFHSGTPTYLSDPTGFSYISPYTFPYTIKPVHADMDQSQGFICSGAAGRGEIHVKGTEGFPGNPLAPYRYYLARQGRGVNGPYIADNTTGVFTNFGANAGEVYDIKITDSCGGFAVQPFEILDLEKKRLISSSTYVGCDSATVRLSALYLPGATYSWSGPNGFTSSLRNPVIEKIGPPQRGVYRVEITTPQCGRPFTDTTIITSNIKPPVPLVSRECAPQRMTIVNPSPGISYTWEIKLDLYGYSYQRTESSDTGYTKYPPMPGRYLAIATDTLTRCISYSDSFMVGMINTDTLMPYIYTPHADICPGDSATLVANTHTLIPSFVLPGYQWFRNGVPIAGATQQVYVTDQPGQYKVRIAADSCIADTSSEITVSRISLPAVTLHFSDTDICAGNTTTIQAATGPGYIYTWIHDGNTIPGAHTSTLNVTKSGDYYVAVANAGCAVISDTVSIHVYPVPVTQINPAGPQSICTGDTVYLSTLSDPSWSYTWYRNTTLIPGINGYSCPVSAAGIYMVKVESPYCPVASDSITVSMLPIMVSAGNDTLICNTEALSLPLSASSGFDRYVWSNGLDTRHVTATTGGTWWVRATNKCGSFTDTVHIRTLSDFLPYLPADTLICNAANQAILNVRGQMNPITWNTGAQTPDITITSPGIYWVAGGSPCGLLQDTVNVRFCAPRITDLRLSEHILCAGACIDIAAGVENYPQQYQWSFPGGNPAYWDGPQPPEVCYREPGTFTLSLTTTNAGGSDRLAVPVTVLPIPAGRFTDTIVTVPYKSFLVLPACGTAETVDWYSGDSLVCTGCPSLNLRPLHWRATYHCVLRNGNCTDTCTYEVRTTDIPSDITMPTAFTPNNDGKNDYFRIVTDNPNIYTRMLTVFNRWGNQVYAGNNINGWDGYHKSVPAPAGTYFWHLVYGITGNNETWSLKGDVILMR